MITLDNEFETTISLMNGKLVIRQGAAGSVTMELTDAAGHATCDANLVEVLEVEESIAKRSRATL